MEPPIIAVSDKSNLQVPCRLEEAITDSKGTFTGKTKRLVAQFQRGGAPPWVVEEATKRFKFRGMGEGDSIPMMIGYFSSAEAAMRYKWSEEEHDAVVRHLRDTPNPYWVIVEAPRVDPPWPTYDKLVAQGQRTWDKVAEQNIRMAEATGIPLDALIAYEKQNRNDANILASYQEAQKALEPEAEAEELVEA